MAAWAVRPDRPVQGRADGRRHQRLGHAGRRPASGASSDAALGGSSGWEGPGPHRHDQLSPISYASQIRTPVLILHGEQDTNVPLGQAMYFHRALRHFGVEHEFVVYPREGHGSGTRPPARRPAADPRLVRALALATCPSPGSRTVPAR